MDDAEDEMKSCRRHLAEGYRNEKQRNRDFTAKVEDLENKVKEEGDKAEPEPEPEKVTYFRYSSLYRLCLTYIIYYIGYIGFIKDYIDH